MKIRHRVPVDRLRLTDPVTPEYQAEVDQHTARLERDYRQAQQRLADAENRARRIERRTVSRVKQKAHERATANAWAVVELHRIELEKYERMMLAVPASAQHRSREAHRPIPVSDSGRLL
jgi:hypothetical protein